MNKILVVAPHVDDETLGCGGTLLRHKSYGDEIYWLIVTKPNQALSDKKNLIELQKIYITNASFIYKFTEIQHLEFLATELEKYSLNEIIININKVIQKIRPNIIYLPNINDVHSDHKTVFEATYSCTKCFRAPFIEKILMYETLSETEFAPTIHEKVFIPNYFVDITTFIEKKIEIMKIYQSEVMPSPFPRSLSSIRALARYRGSRIGVEYAEAFQLLFEKVF